MDFFEDISRWERKLETLKAEADEFRRIGQHVARVRCEDEAHVVRRHIKRLERLASKAP